MRPAVAFFLAAGFLVVLPLGATEAAITISSPLPRQVFQRAGFDPLHAHAHEAGGPKLGYADVPIAANLSGVSDQAAMEFRVIPLENAYGSGRGWNKLEAVIDGGRLKASARVAAGGWYRLELRGEREGGWVTAALEPFGVGEVFVVAGQSYAGGANAELLKIDDPQGRVVAYDPVQKAWKIANDPLANAGVGGTIWPALGNLLLPVARVPIGFVDVAVGGTSSRQWLPGETLYQNLAAAGRAMGRFRAVLWQQGESDVVDRTTTAKYVANLTEIREKLAAEWGFAPLWLPAKSTLHPTAYDNPAGEQAIRDAIDELWRRPGFFPGPDTDILGGENRAGFKAGRHLTGIGQRRAGLLWFASIWAMLNQGPAEPPPKS